MKNPSELYPIKETKYLSFEELKHSKKAEIEELRKKVLDLTKDEGLVAKIKRTLSRWDLKQKILYLLELRKINDLEIQEIQNEASYLTREHLHLLKNIERALELLQSGEINDPAKANEIQTLKSKFRESPSELIIEKNYMSHIEEKEREKIINELEEIIKTIWHIKEAISKYASIIQTNQLNKAVLGLINNDCKKNDKQSSKDIISDILAVLDIDCCSPPEEFCTLIKSRHAQFKEDAQLRKNSDPNQKQKKTRENSTNSEIIDFLPSIKSELTQEHSEEKASKKTKARHQHDKHDSDNSDPKPLKGEHPSVSIKFDSFITIETNLNEECNKKIAMILNETKYMEFKSLINKQSSEWEQYQKQIDSLESKRETLKNQNTNESDAELKEALKNLNNQKSKLKQKQQRARIDAATYSESIKFLNQDKAPEKIEIIIKTTNKTLEEIFISKQVLYIYKKILETKTLPFKDPKFLNRHVNTRKASKALVEEILDKLGIPRTYFLSLPLEILKLVLPNVEEENQNLESLAQETSQNILPMTDQPNQKPGEKFRLKEEEKALIRAVNTKTPLQQVGMFNESSQPSVKFIDIRTESESSNSKNIYNKADSSPKTSNEVITDCDHDPDPEENSRKIRR